MSVRAILRELPSLGNRNQYLFSKSLPSSSSSRHGVRALSSQAQNVELVAQNHLIPFLKPLLLSVKYKPQSLQRPVRNSKIELANNPPLMVAQPLEKSLDDHFKEIRNSAAERQLEKILSIELEVPFSLELVNFYIECLSGDILSEEAKDHCFATLLAYAKNPLKDPGIREFIIYQLPELYNNESMTNQSVELSVEILFNPNESSELKRMISKQLCAWIWNNTLQSSLNPTRMRIIDALLSYRESARCEDTVWIIDQDLIQAMINFQKIFACLSEKPAFQRQATVLKAGL